MCLCLLFSLTGVAVGLSGYFGINSVVGRYSRVSGVSLPNLQAVNDMYLHYRQVRIHLRTLGLPGLSPTEAAAAVEEAKDSIREYEDADRKYQEAEFSPGERELYARVQASWGKFRKVGETALGLNATGTETARAELIRLFLKDCPTEAKEYDAAISALVAFHKGNAAEWVKDADALQARTSQIMLLIVIVGVGFSMGVGFLIATSVSRSIHQVAQGLAERAAQVSEEIQHIADASQSLSSSATQQASALQQTTAAVDQTSSMVAKNAENAHRSSEVSSASQQSATRGQEAVAEMIRSIEDISASNSEITTQIEASNREIGEIVKVIQEIGTKTKVINDIVFQTKLLSFNASVEAARAGEQGKGFAVVAEEIGNLAQMSGNAAREISEMLDSSVQQVEKIVEATRGRVDGLVTSGKEKVQGGASMARRCGEVLDEVVRNVSLVGSLVSEISSASREQAQGVEEISKAMVQLDQVAQQNSAASLQSSQTAESLRGSVTELHRLVGQLNGMIQGSSQAA